MPEYRALQHKLQLNGSRQVGRRGLESALSSIGILSDNPRELVEDNQGNELGEVLSRIPSTKLLAWVLKGTPPLTN
ncbi:hypothetical protein N7536_003729 [Penicillium majusculum]|nr:hypothetical protein N7536_003729 [Penicillium majusculum]